MSDEIRRGLPKYLTRPFVKERKLTTRVGDCVQDSYETEIIFPTQGQKLVNVKKAELYLFFMITAGGNRLTTADPILLFGYLDILDTSNKIRATTPLIGSQTLSPGANFLRFDITKLIKELPQEEFRGSDRLVNVVFQIDDSRHFKEDPDRKVNIGVERVPYSTSLLALHHNN